MEHFAVAVIYLLKKRRRISLTVNATALHAIKKEDLLELPPSALRVRSKNDPNRSLAHHCDVDSLIHLTLSLAEEVVDATLSVTLDRSPYDELRDHHF